MSGPQDAPWDQDEDDGGFDDESVLDAFALYEPADIGLDWDAAVSHTEDDVVTVVFTACNPAGTVCVSALMDGKVVRIDLTPGVTSMSEPELAAEVRLIARLASRQALAGQHLVTAALMRRLGRDPAETRSFLERELHLPTPESVMSERAALFAAHYAHVREDG